MEGRKNLGIARGWSLGRACGYRMDFVVMNELIVELRAVDHLLPIHEAQLITYLKLSGLNAGLLVNFHAQTIRRGLRRLSRIHSSSALPPSC